MLIAFSRVAQSVRSNVQTEEEKREMYRKQIGLDYSMPNYSVTSIDEKKMGSRLTNLLLFYDETNKQSIYTRWVNTILGEQNEAFENAYIEIKKQKLVKVEKSGDEIIITYRLWFHKNAKNIKQTDVYFHFKDGVSESQIVNEMFSSMSHYVEARENLHK